MKRRGLASLWVIALLAITISFGVRQSKADESTPTGNNCASLSGYLADLHDLASDLADGEWTPVASPASQYGNDKILSASPDELAETGKKFQEYADGLRGINPPAIAKAWHESRIKQMQTFANAYQAMSQNGLFAAFAFTDAFQINNDLAFTTEYELIDVCPAFWDGLRENDYLGDYINYDKITLVATPTS